MVFDHSLLQSYRKILRLSFYGLSSAVQGLTYNSLALLVILSFARSVNSASEILFC